MGFKDKRSWYSEGGISGIGACELLEKSGATVILFVAMKSFTRKQSA